MKMVLHVLVVTTIFSVVTLYVEGMISKVNVLPNFGCAHGLKDDLYHFHDLSACKGTWDGHVEHASSLCSNGWHVCSWNDTALLSLVSWYKAVHMHGCYAINAAHDGKTCGECSATMADMAGVGADCPRQQKNLNSCFGRGKIDANLLFTDNANNQEACNYARWISGVICCRNRVVGQPPHIIESPTPSLRVRLDGTTELRCRATGSPLPHITWFRNAMPVDETTMKSVLHIDKQKDTTSSTLTIVKSAKQHEGLYSCQAENRHGNAVSYSSSVRVYGDGSNVNACRNIDSQHLISGRSENIAACDGRWKGSVRHAGKQLCAKGWQVCSSRHRHLLNRLSWTDTLQLTGCFALNSATSNNFACTKCSPRQKGNRLSGIGSECGYIDRSQSSCLNKGRIDVWPSSSTETNEVFSIQGKKFTPRRATNSCQYVEGLTTGVMCCKKRRDKKVPLCAPGCEGGGICTTGNSCSCPPDRTGSRCQIDLNANRCSKPCGANSHCTSNGVCKCDQGYKLMGNQCIYRGYPSVTSQCSESSPCLNGGTCTAGVCTCRANYKGERCETRAYKTMMEVLVEQLYAAMGS